MGDFNRLDLEPILSNLLIQIVNQPTRNDAILDKIITNLANSYHPVEIAPPIGLSDHHCVIMKPKNPPPRDNSTCKRVVRPMKDSDVREFGLWISEHDWSEVRNASSSNEKCPRARGHCVSVGSDLEPLDISHSNWRHSVLRTNHAHLLEPL